MSLNRTRWDMVSLALAAGYIVGLQVGKVPPALPLLHCLLPFASLWRAACCPPLVLQAPLPTRRDNSLKRYDPENLKKQIRRVS